ncbi:MAG: GGDEF domain-containing protein [Gammaproteobacteria bacterium]|nr:GGDEF domain-containing protein [Gammaproteobacteria bacterium]
MHTEELSACCRYDQIVSLSQQRDFESLNRVLLSIVKESYGEHDVSLFVATDGVRAASETIELMPFECCDEEGGDGCSKLGESQPINELFSDLPTSFESGKPVIYPRSGGCRWCTVFPLLEGHTLTGVLLVEGRTALPTSPYMAAITSIYANQNFLLRNCSHDALTGLYNREAFGKMMYRINGGGGDGESHRRRSEEVSWCFALFDIDHFKRVNDQFGHVFGDEVLLRFSQTMAESFRQDDLLFRYGGEEFAVALKNINLDIAAGVLERFRSRVETTLFPGVGRVTVSIGYTDLSVGEVIPTIVERADKALYHSKENGRNQTNCYDHLLELGVFESADADSGSIELF